MSERVLSILLSELATIRIKCAKCRTNATVELPISKLDRIDSYECPICKVPFSKDGADKTNHLQNLQEAIEGLAADRDRLSVEFIIAAGDTRVD